MLLYLVLKTLYIIFLHTCMHATTHVCFTRMAPFYGNVISYNITKKAYHYRQYYLISINSMNKTVQNNISTCKNKNRYNLTIKFQIVFDRFKDEVKVPRKVTRILGIAYLYGYVRI